MKSTSRIGKNNYNWRGGRPKCTSCGKVLPGWRATKCRSCYSKFMSVPENNNNYKHGRTHNNRCKCGNKMSLLAKQCQSCNQTRLRRLQWKTEDYRNKLSKVQLRGRTLTKNKTEKVVHKLIGKGYRFNTKTYIYGFVPDFVCDKHRKIIEFFGTYWHKNTQKRDRRRLKAYRKAGYKTLVLWDTELKNIPKLANRIKRFSL